MTFSTKQGVKSARSCNPTKGIQDLLRKKTVWKLRAILSDVNRVTRWFYDRNKFLLRDSAKKKVKVAYQEYKPRTSKRNASTVELLKVPFFVAQNATLLGATAVCSSLEILSNETLLGIYFDNVISYLSWLNIALLFYRCKHSQHFLVVKLWLRNWSFFFHPFFARKITFFKHSRLWGFVSIDSTSAASTILLYILNVFPGVIHSNVFCARGTSNHNFSQYRQRLTTSSFMSMLVYPLAWNPL